MKPTREELAQALDEASWDVLRAQPGAGGLIVTSRELDLIEAGLKIATDNTPVVDGWIRERKLTRPTAEQVASWDLNRGKLFLCLIVSPYVLIQEKPDILQ